MGEIPPVPPLLAIFTWFGSGGGEMAEVETLVNKQPCSFSSVVRVTVRHMVLKLF